MRDKNDIKSKRNKLKENLHTLESEFNELYQSRSLDEGQSLRNERNKKIDTIMKDMRLIKGQIEALTYVLNEDFVMSELDKDNRIAKLVHNDWRDAYQA